MAKEKGELDIINAVDRMFFEAVEAGSSDIHIEPGENAFMVRHRVDGALKLAFQGDKETLKLVLARIKILAGLDTTGQPRPQEGKIKFRFLDRDVDLRVSIFPTSNGECAVIRILENLALYHDWNDLGLDENQLVLVQEAIKKPYGLILVTGPNGSGKSTTLFTMLNSINEPEKSIVTLEDPVERKMDNVRQTQIDPDIDLTFAAGLRFLLRQDPDVIMVGEIRDPETAKISVQAAITGHLVFATIHTNNAAGAVIRLVNMGIEPYLVASALRMAIAQRLARKICQACKEEYEPPVQLLEKLKLDKSLKYYRGRGCPECNGKGIKGRIGIHEVLPVNKKIQEAILSNPTDDYLYSLAKESGMTSLHEAAIKKVQQGIITIEEALRLTE